MSSTPQEPSSADGTLDAAYVRGLARNRLKRMSPLAQRDPERISQVLAELERVWRANPDMRLGQLVLNAHRREGAAFAREPDLFNVEDDVLLEKLRRWDTPRPA